MEGLSELLSGFAISSFVSPAVFGKKNFRRNIRAGGRDAEAEDVVDLVIDGIKRTIVDSVDDRARDLNGETFTNAVSAATPTGVDEPNLGAVLSHVSGQQFSVLGRVPNEERGAKASGEGRLRFFNTNFGTGDLGGVTGNEVVHRLFGGQLAHRRKNAESVAGEKNDVLRMTALAAFLDVFDVVDRIGSASVFGERVIVEVDFASFGIENGVFKNGTELDRVEDFGFAFSGQVDALRIAAAFNVDNAFVGPIVFVVADELTARFGGESRFTGTGKTEEQAGVAVFAFVRGAVHGQEAFFRHQVVHDRENALLHFAGVFSAENDEFLTFEREVDARARGEGRRRRIGFELTGVENDEVRFAEFSEFLSGRTDQHVVHEQRVISASADDTNLKAVFRIPTSVSVNDVEVVASIEVIDRARAVLQERGIGHLDIDGTPPNIVRAFRIVDDTLIFRATTGLLTRGVHQRARGSDRRFFVGDSVFIKFRGGRITKNVGYGDSVLR